MACSAVALIKWIEGLAYRPSLAGLVQLCAAIPDSLLCDRMRYSGSSGQLLEEIGIYRPNAAMVREIASLASLGPAELGLR